MITPQALPDWLAHHAAVAPGHAALVADHRTWTYAELDADVTRTARQLASLGVDAGDRVAVLVANGALPVLLAHATLRLGATLVPLNTRLSRTEIAWQVAHASPRVLVVDAQSAPTVDQLWREHPAVTIVSATELAAEPERMEARLIHVHDPAHVRAIIYTSGTTGKPKGAMLTVGNFWWSAIGSALNLGTHVTDRWLACLPLFHVGGLSIVERAAIYGITAIVPPAFDAPAVNQAIDEEGVTIVSVVAVMLERMLAARGGRPYPPTLRCVLLGGGPASAGLLARCAALGVPVVQTYGLTEATSQVATLAPRDALRKLGSAGRALYPNALRIIRDDGDEAAVGEPGEIAVRGPIVMAGYAGNADATAHAVAGGWLRTGDVGRLDDEGFLYVMDRRDDLVITGGENVYPAEVEAVLADHPWVAEAGVIGEPDDEWGQRVVALVRLADGVDADANVGETLRAHCRTRLAAYKSPAEVRIVKDALPRTASGKLRRSLLRQQGGITSGEA